jgi:two-component system nitrate/nitrite sensor histidine kinase NarX
MERDLLTIRWVTFVALVSTAAIYRLPLLPSNPVLLAANGFLILIAAGFLTWAVEASLRYLVRRLSPTSGKASHEEGETEALRLLQSSTGQQDLPALLGELAGSIRSAAGADYALFWFADGLFGGQKSAAFLTFEPSENALEIRFVTHSLMHGIWQRVSTSGDPLALEDLAFSPEMSRIFLRTAPMAWRHEPPVGLVVLGSRRPLDLSERQLLLVRTLAGESALIVQNARLMVRVEYQAVVDERARLAREIHDGLAQTLAFLKIQAAQMQYYLREGKLDRLEETLAASQQGLGEAYQDTRRAIDNLRSRPETSTREWLLRIARDFESSSGLPIDTSRLHLERDLPPTVQAQLVRIVQEALSNVRKHSHARRVTLSASEQAGRLLIEVQDDGAGFNPAQADPDSRYGLLGMRERARVIGAEIEVQSRPGSGTAVRLHLPLPEPESQ